MKLGKKPSLKRIVASIILASVLLITSFSSAIAAPQKFGSFTLEIVDTNFGLTNSAKSNSLAGIKLDIYDAVLDRVDAATGIMKYAHNLVRSVYTQPDGTITFKKPSESFVVMVDLTTLPNGVGIEKDTIFYRDASQRSGSLSLSVITDVVVSYDFSAENGVRVDVFNANADMILAHYIVTPDVISNARAALLDGTCQISGSVNVNGIVKYYKFTVTNNTDPIERVANALKENQISKEEALDFYLDIWESGAFGECGTYLVSQLVILGADTAFVNQLSTEKQQTLARVTTWAPPPYTAWYRGISGTGSFWVHYYHSNQSGLQTNNAPQAVKDIYIALEDAYNKFCSSSSAFKFSAPYSPSAGSAMYVYVEIEPYPNGYTWPDSYDYPHTYNGNSSIVIRTPSLTTLTQDDTDRLKSATVHEYFHAIQHKYNDFLVFYGGNPWFFDGFASWSSRKVYGAIGNGYSEMNAFLGSPNTSLINPPNIYGACLLPMYLEIKHGDTTIKNIVTRAYSSGNIDLCNEINYVTPFDSAFSQFWVHNYAPWSTYSKYIDLYASPTLLNKPGTQGYTSPNKTAVVNPLACQFIDFSMPSPGSTMWLIATSASNLKCFVILRTSSGTINQTDITSQLGLWTSVIIPVLQSGMYDMYGSVALINVGKTNTATSTITIS